MTKRSESAVLPPVAAPPAAEPAIRLTGLRKHYGQVRAVDGVDLEIARGEVVALLGPNGAGKTTTIDMILGLTAPDSGEVAIFGRSPWKAVRDSLVGATLQEGTLIDDASVREIVAMAASLYKHPLKVDEVLRRAGIEDIAGRRSAKLSGGQKARVRFAIALVGDPDLLLLDEPTAAMDVVGRREFWASMRRFTDGGGTVVFATHYLDEAQEFADRVVMMRGGQIIADGSVAEIRSRVSGRKVSAVVPGARIEDLLLLPGVVDGTIRGERAELHCTDSDACLRALLGGYEGAHDIEIEAAGLEEAFVRLTLDEPEEARR
jgi:ABC-2 type transport system ATP-binding protein